MPYTQKRQNANCNIQPNMPVNNHRSFKIHPTALWVSLFTWNADASENFITNGHAKLSKNVPNWIYIILTKSWGKVQLCENFTLQNIFHKWNTRLHSDTDKLQKSHTNICKRYGQITMTKVDGINRTLRILHKSFLKRQA